jgi:hypothetical protein
MALPFVTALPLLLLDHSHRIGKVSEIVARSALWVSSGLLFLAGLAGLYWIALTEEETLSGVPGLSIWSFQEAVMLANRFSNDAAQGLLFGAALGGLLSAIVPSVTLFAARLYKRWKKKRGGSVSVSWKAGVNTGLLGAFRNYSLLYGFVMLTGIYYSIWPANLFACEPNSFPIPYNAYVEFLLFTTIAPAVIYQAECWQIKSVATATSEPFSRVVRDFFKQFIPLSSVTAFVVLVVRLLVILPTRWPQYWECVFGRPPSIWFVTTLVLYPFLTIAPAVFASFASLIFITRIMRKEFGIGRRIFIGLLGFAGLLYFAYCGFFVDLGSSLRDLKLYLPYVPWALIFSFVPLNPWMLSLTPLLIGVIVTLTLLVVGKPINRIGLKGFVALTCCYFSIAMVLILLPLRLGLEESIIEYPHIVAIWIAVATAVNSMVLVIWASEKLFSHISREWNASPSVS